MPRLIAHRGYAARHPENTLAAFAAALRAGADAVELDVQFSADGEPVVLHDATLDRVSGRPGCVWARPAVEVLGQPAHEPARLGAAHVGASVPSLAAAVALLAPQPVEVFIELKAETLAVRGVTASVARVLAELAPLGERCWLISFAPAALRAARAGGAARIGWCLPDYSAATRAAAEALAPDLLFADQRDLGPDPAPLWPGPWRWASWELGTDAARSRALLARGCDYLETYEPAGLRSALGA